MLFVISAPSGAGKTSIVKRILEEDPELTFSVSATSRNKRGNEEEGKDYFFLTKKGFEEKIENDELIEYEKLFNDCYYGTLKSFVDDAVEHNKDLIFDIDVKGAISLKRIYDEKAVLIFIKPPDRETLKKRLVERKTEQFDHIEERLKRFDMEMAAADEFDKEVVNDDLETAVNEVENIINGNKEK